MAKVIKANDFTGKEREAGLVANREELARRSQEISTAANVESALNDSAVFDARTGQVLANSEDDLVLEEVSVGEAKRKDVVVRVNEDLEMTFGVGNNYTFVAGKKYTVAADLADHLDSKGYVWH